MNADQKVHASRFSLRRLHALIIKEFYQIIRDPSSILIAFILPLILLFLYGVGVSLDASNIRIGLVLQDTSPDAQSFAQSFMHSHYFDVTVGRDIAPFKDDIVNGKLRGIIVIPSYFSSFRKQQALTAPIEVIADGSEPNTANFLQNFVLATWQTWLSQEGISQHLEGLSDIQVQSRFRYNAELDSRNSLVPGSLAIVMTLIGTLLTALVVSREWERGTMEALMSTSVTMLELILGKLIPYFILGLGSMTVCIAVSTLVYNIPLRGSLWLLFLVTAVFLFVALGVGLLISTLAKNQFVAAQAAVVSGFLPAFILSGFIFEISSMPPIIQYVTNIVPARYFVVSLQTLFLAGDIWSVVLQDIAVLLGMGVLLSIIILSISVKRLD